MARKFGSPSRGENPQNSLNNSSPSQYVNGGNQNQPTTPQRTISNSNDQSPESDRCKLNFVIVPLKKNDCCLTFQ